MLVGVALLGVALGVWRTTSNPEAPAPSPAASLGSEGPPPTVVIKPPEEENWATPGSAQPVGEADALLDAQGEDAREALRVRQIARLKAQAEKAEAAGNTEQARLMRLRVEKLDQMR